MMSYGVIIKELTHYFITASPKKKEPYANNGHLYQ